MGAPTVNYYCGEDKCGLRLFTLDASGILTQIIRLTHEPFGPDDYHHELAVGFANERGERVDRWQEAKASGPLASLDAIAVSCPRHGRWHVSSSELAAAVLLAQSNRLRQLNIKGTAAQPLP